ncbi:MAG: GMC family oxidoreductase [Microthrixaceae bacterium]|nr:GMC family oxidoreductase [Microthrixaceae bacterium]
MFTQADDVPGGSTVGADVVVAGAGAAGITLARELASSGARVLLLESGGLDYDQDTQDLYQGTSTGSPYAVAESRLRYFGGTTNHWGGWVRPLDPVDFTGRPWVPHTGWPIDYGALGDHYGRALELATGLDDEPFEWSHWSDTHEDVEEFAPGSGVRSAVFRIAPVRFGEAYRGELRDSTDIQVHLGANVVEVATDASGTRVEDLTVRTLGGNQYRVGAPRYVLALGGIENARVMLASSGSVPGGVGNTSDLVGRYFMDHIEGDVATLVASTEIPSIYLGGRYDLARAMLTLDEDLIGDNELAGVGFVVEPLADASEVPDGGIPIRSVASVMEALSGGRPTTCALGVRAEPEPNPESRVTLGDDTDALGMPRIRLHRRLTEGDHRRLRRSVEVMASQLGAAGAGWTRVEEILDGTDEPLLYGWHHMGTTRMGRDSADSVVNPDCRVHEVENLWIAGSSVFPSAGYANPTLTIVALALRLGEHISAAAAR